MRISLKRQGDMHIPIKVDYGVRALVDLALVDSDTPTRAADVARRTAIPEQFLAQVLHTLGKSGLVKSQRGPQGGHTLGMDPSEIRLSMIMSQLGVGDTPVGCLDDFNMCIHVQACAQREVWARVSDAVFQILDSTSIADLVERTLVVEAQLLNRKAQPVEISLASASASKN